MMDCRQVNQLLPLWVGQDLQDAKIAAEVGRHLSQCPECEKRRISLQTSLDSLQAVSVSAVSDKSSIPTLWARLAPRVAHWESVQYRERFNGWIPASVMSLAVALMIAVSLPSLRDEFFGGHGNDTNVVDLFETIPDAGADGNFKVSSGNMASLRTVSAAVARPVDYKPDQW